METQTPDVHTILVRLEKLERQNRRLKRGAVAVLIAISALLLMGQGRLSRTIEANKFVLKDADGRARAEMDLQSGGNPTLCFRDANGYPTILMGGGDEPSLDLSLPNFKERVELFAAKKSYGLGLYDSVNRSQTGGGIRAGLSVLFQDAPEVGGSPSLDLYDNAGNDRASLTFVAGEPILALSDPNGFATHIGGTYLVIPATGEKRTTSAASIVMFDKENNAIWRAP